MILKRYENEYKAKEIRGMTEKTKKEIKEEKRKSQMKIHKAPRLFEYDEEEDIVDVFVYKDPDCSYPFTNDEWWHQGFYLKEFIIILDIFLQKNNLSYKIIEK